MCKTSTTNSPHFWGEYCNSNTVCIEPISKRVSLLLPKYWELILECQ
jgi:hypothetical protein